MPAQTLVNALSQEENWP